MSDLPANKPTILLLHGIVSSRLDWVDLIPTLTTAGYPAHALDLLGHGDGLKPTEAADYSLENYLSHFESWIEQENFPTPLVLIGHSLGGYLSLTYTYRHPEKVKGLVLIAPLYSSRQLSPWLKFVKRRPGMGVKAFGSFQRTMGWTANRRQSSAASTRDQAELDALRASPNVFHVMSSLADLDSQITNIQSPSLVIWGTRDFLLNPRQFPPLVNSLSQAEPYIVPNAGHEPHREFPELVSSKILEFVNHI